MGGGQGQQGGGGMWGGPQQPQRPGLGNIGQPPTGYPPVAPTPYTPPQNQPGSGYFLGGPGPVSNPTPYTPPQNQPRQPQPWTNPTGPQWGQRGPMQPQIPKWAQPQPPTDYTRQQDRPGFNLSEYGERIQALDQGNFSGGDLRGYGRAIQEFNRPYGPQPTPGYPQQPPIAGFPPRGPGGPGTPQPGQGTSPYQFYGDTGITPPWAQQDVDRMKREAIRDQRFAPGMQRPMPRPGRGRAAQQRDLDRQFQDFRQNSGGLGNWMGHRPQPAGLTPRNARRAEVDARRDQRRADRDSLRGLDRDARREGLSAQRDQRRADRDVRRADRTAQRDQRRQMGRMRRGIGGLGSSWDRSPLGGAYGGPR